MKRNAATLNRDMLVYESSREHFALYSSVWLEHLRMVANTCFSTGFSHVLLSARGRRFESCKGHNAL